MAGTTRASSGWRLAAGGWRLAAGGWRLAAGGWRIDKYTRSNREKRDEREFYWFSAKNRSPDSLVSPV